MGTAALKLWVRHHCIAGHAAAIAPLAASGVTIHQDERGAEHTQELTLLASVPVTGGHWSPLAEGEVVVLSGGKLAERTM